MPFYPSIPAGDGTSLVPPANALFEVYELTDTGFTTPLPLTTSAGVNAAPLITTAQGVVPPVNVTSPNLSHIFKSGSWEWRRDSFDGAAKAVEDARAAAEAAALNAEAPTDESVDAGLQRVNLPKLAADAVAASPTVSAAAAAAVGAAIQTRGVLATQPTPEDVALSITDGDDRRSWLEIALDGGPTRHSVDVLVNKLSPLLGGQLKTFAHETGYVFAIVDDEDRIAFGVRADGTTTAASADAAKPKTRIVGWGDSLTHADGGIWTSRLAQLLGVEVVPRGVSGERAQGIASRQGGVRRILTPAGGKIPASGSVTVTADGVFVLPNANSSKGVQDGYIAGVRGTLSEGATASEWVFTRTTPGVAVTVTSAPWISVDSDTYRNDLPIFWAGRNNFPYDIDVAPDSAGTALQAMIDFQNNGSRFVIATVLNGSGEGRTGNPSAYAAVTSYTQWLQTNWPGNVLDIRRYLIDRGLSDAGITPTAQDLADIADDTVPASLRKDWIHLTPKGYTLVADQYAAFITSKGWVK